MSVHQESLEITKPVERVENPPELEYTAVRNDSLAMFGAAIGGAVLGMLLTLLILAIINGGTLSFTGGERLAVFEAQLARIDENLNAVSYNVNVVAQQTAAIQDEVAEAGVAMQSELDGQDAAIAGLNEAVASLDRTRQQFDLFVTALADAMSTVQESMSAVSGEVESASVAAPTGDAGESAAPTALLSTLLESADVPAGALSVRLFADANSNGVFDEGEGLSDSREISLLNAGGDVVASTTTSGEAGALFEALTSGDYTLAIDGVPVNSANVTFATDEGEVEGKVLYVAPDSE